MRWLGYIALLLCAPTFAALPTGEGYLEITLPAPDSAISNASILVDLSDHTLNSSWTAQWNTNSNGYGRASKEDGTTELATDWIDLDYTAETGQVRVLYSGSWSSTSNKIRLWPPNTARSQYSASDTYGSENAYESNLAGAWPLSVDANDRTSNGTTLSEYGSISVGGQSGQAGDSTLFDDASSQYLTTGSVTYNFANALTMVAWFKLDDTTQDNGIFGPWAARA